MNDEAARHSRPDVIPNRSQADYPLRRFVRELERLRSGIWQAIEAHEVGDTRLACDILLALVEDGPDLREAA